MTTRAIAAILVGVVAFVLDVSHNALLTSSVQDLDYACARQNGTVCNIRATEECKFHGLVKASQRHESALNHEALIHLVILMNRSTLLRYFKLEWTQASSFQTGAIFVRVSPLAQSLVMQTEVICLSDFVANETKETVTDRPAMNAKELRHSTLVPPISNLTSTLVEVFTDNGYSEILVVLPVYSRHSFILQGVSITVHDRAAYISLSRPSSRLIGRYHQVIYTLTLQCYTYVKGGNLPNRENSSNLNIPPSSLTSTFCSGADKEIILTHDTLSPRPVVFEMSHPAYELVVDAKLINVASESAVGATSLRTTRFGFWPYGNGSSSVAASRSAVWTTLKLNVAQIIQDPDVNSSGLESPSIAESSASVSSSYEKEEITTPDITAVIWGVCVSAAALVLVVGILVMIKRVTGKRSSNTVSQIAIPEKYDVISVIKKNSEKHYIALDNQPAISNGRKPKLRSDCCSTRYSDLSSSSNLSDFLISTSQMVNESSHENTHQNQIKIELTVSDVTVSKDGVQDFKYEIRLNGNLPQKQSESDKKCDTVEFSHDRVRTFTDSSMYLPTKLLLKETQNYYCSSELKKGWDSMPSFKDLEVEAMNQENSEINCLNIIEPKLLPGEIEPVTMQSEFMKINQTYSKLIKDDVNMLQVPSCDNLVEDECYSICDSVAC